MFPRLKVPTPLVTLALLTSLVGWGVGTQAADVPLSQERFAKVHRIVLPQDGELKWLSVPWLTSITLARHHSAVENKPLFVFADTGAGFADALGLC